MPVVSVDATFLPPVAVESCETRVLWSEIFRCVRILYTYRLDIDHCQGPNLVAFIDLSPETGQ